METKQSSIEWLYKELLNSEPNILEWNKLLEQAKEIHNQEIVEATAALTSVKSAEDWWNKNKREAMDFIGSCEVITKEDFIELIYLTTKNKHQNNI